MPSNHSSADLVEKKKLAGRGNQPLSAPAHTLTVETLVSELQANLSDGLTSAEADSRLEKYGPNELGAGKGVSAGGILVRQICNAMVLVLILALAVSFAIQSWVEGAVVAVVILLNVGIGFMNEYSAEKTMDSLRNLSSPTAHVVRSGGNKTVPTADVTVGDMVEVKMGDTIPADIRIVEAVNFETDEMVLTGESLPVGKEADKVFEDQTSPGDRLNVAYSTTTVTKGRARGIVFATGMSTEVGSIASALNASTSRIREVKRNDKGKAGPHRYAQAGVLTVADAVGHFLGVNVGTPLQKKLARLACYLFIIAVICSIIVLGANGFSNNQEVIIYAVATGLSMLPASLIVVLTITMAAGTKAMVHRNVIVRNIKALESLGSISDICSDKTGTITQGKMLVAKAWIPSRGTYVVDLPETAFDPTQGEVSRDSREPRDMEDDDDSSIEPTEKKDDASSMDAENDKPLHEFLNIASMCNLAHVHKDKNDAWVARGDPTEIAIQVFASRFDWNRDRFTTGNNAAWKQLSEFPFDSSIKRMSVIFQQASTGEKFVFTKGAVERIIDKCDILYFEDDKEEKMTDEIRDHILENMEALARMGLRTLALASRRFTEDDVVLEKETGRDIVEQGLIFRGLVGIYDPPRPESAPSVKRCHEAGIVVHMLTGDHVGTATSIAKQVGILPPHMDHFGKEVADAMVMTAPQFDKLSHAEQDSLPALPLVIARCTPETKVNMIEALHRRKKFAAMTGDGVNDSPSLDKSDVGIAMGQAGSDVAKNASDIVLSDDNFASILNGIEEGRRMFDNIQKFVLHLLAQNVALAITLLVGLAFKDGSGFSVFPISPVEIMWIIMVTSSFPDMGLGFEAAGLGIMKRPPQNLKKGVFTWEVVFDIIFYGLWVGALCLAAFVLVIYGFNEGSLGENCNDSYSQACDDVFRARATSFACMTWFSLFLAWFMVDTRTSFFSMSRGEHKYFWQVLWSNKFLFWSIILGFFTIFPVLYIPGLSTTVFKHKGFGWEWTIVFINTLLFFAGVEAWKWGKRVYFRRMGEKEGDLEAAAQRGQSYSEPVRR